MDRATTEQHLALAEKIVEQAERHVRRQREVADELKRDGYDACKAEELLLAFEKSRSLHIAELERLRDELAATDLPGGET
jgi:hypothetical protein